MMVSSKLASLFTPALLSLSVSGNPLAKRAPPGTAVITDRSFADPSILLQGNRWYAYASGANGPHVQFATAACGQFEGPWDAGPLPGGRDAMPDISNAQWINQEDSAIFGPDVIDMGDGNYVLYFSAKAANPINPPQPDKSYHCIGAATGTAAGGPFVPLADTLGDCPFEQGGAIDPSGFQDSDGTRYIVYKIDGNNIGDGIGSCGQSKDNPVPTPIMLQRLMADGVTPDGDPVQILDRDPNGADGPYVEAPNLRLVDGTYYLTFSSGCYCDDTYDISWATSDSVSGGYAKAQQAQQPAPLAVTVDGMEAPGGASMNIGATRMAWHYTISGGCPGPMRGMRTATINTGNSNIVFA